MSSSSSLCSTSFPPTSDGASVCSSSTCTTEAYSIDPSTDRRFQMSLSKVESSLSSALDSFEALSLSFDTLADKASLRSSLSTAENSQNHSIVEDIDTIKSSLSSSSSSSSLSSLNSEDVDFSKKNLFGSTDRKEVKEIVSKNLLSPLVESTQHPLSPEIRNPAEDIECQTSGRESTKTPLLSEPRSLFQDEIKTTNSMEPDLEVIDYEKMSVISECYSGTTESLRGWDKLKNGMFLDRISFDEIVNRLTVMSVSSLSMLSRSATPSASHTKYTELTETVARSKKVKRKNKRRRCRRKERKGKQHCDDDVANLLSRVKQDLNALEVTNNDERLLSALTVKEKNWVGMIQNLSCEMRMRFTRHLDQIVPLEFNDAKQHREPDDKELELARWRKEMSF